MRSGATNLEESQGFRSNRAGLMHTIAADLASVAVDAVGAQPSWPNGKLMDARLRDLHVSRDLLVAFPVGLLIGYHRIIRRWLHDTCCIDRPRRDRVLTRCGLPVQRPGLPCKRRLAAVQLRLLPRTVIDLHLYGRNRIWAPGHAFYLIAIAILDHSTRGGLDQHA